MVCSTSVLNPQSWTEVETEVEAASLGTDLHLVFQQIVETGEYTVESLKEKYPKEHGRINQLVSNFLALWIDAREVMTAPECEVSHQCTIATTDAVELVLTGHIDLSQTEAGEALILDYKTGRSHENHYHQVAGYAFLLWDRTGRPENFTVKATVVYLEDNSIQNYAWTAQDLMAWAAEVALKVADSRLTVSRKCGYCRISSSCPAYAAFTKQAIGFFMEDDTQAGKVPWTEMLAEERGALLDKLYVVKRGIDRTELSLKGAMQNRFKDVTRLDLGKGMVYERTATKVRTVKPDLALPILRKRFDQELIDDITSLKLDDVLSLYAKFAPKGKKTEVREQTVQMLIDAGAVEIETQERFGRRPADEQTTKEPK